MSIDISRPWARTGSATELRAAGFMTLANKGKEADRLVAAISPLAEKIEIHGIKVVGPGIAMCPLEKGVGLPPDTIITLKPRGYHLLVQGLKTPLAKGQRIPVTLSFEKAGTRQVDLMVEAEGPIGETTLFEK
jgi:hypothetical protein